MSGPEPVDPSSWDAFLRSSSHDVRRLDSVVRFSSIPVTFSESTATHSYWVSLFSLMLWQMLESSGWGRRLPSMEEVLRYAIVHDVGESVTGDVVRTLKYSSKEMKELVDSSEKDLVDKLLHHYVRRAIPKSVSPVTKEIVKAADFLSLWQFMRREAARHNLEIIPYYARMTRDIGSMASSSGPMLSGFYRAILLEADQVSEDCFGALASDSRWTRFI